MRRISEQQTLSSGFLASTSPHERIVERFRAEHGEEQDGVDSDPEAGEFSQLSRRHTGSATTPTDTSGTKLPVPVFRSVSMSDLADNGTTAPGAPSNTSTVNRASGGDSGESSLHLHRAASVEGSLNNKENFAVPRDPSPPSGVSVTSSGSGGKKQGGSKSGGNGRKILNAQNTKSQS